MPAGAYNGACNACLSHLSPKATGRPRRSAIYLASRKRLLLPALFLLLLPLILLVHIPTAVAGGTFSRPVTGPVVRGFETPTGPYGEGGHQGIDIAAPTGTTVRAAADGTVSWVGELPRGRFVTISHAGATRTTYLDLASVAVVAGQRVARGQSIGTLGGTRDSSSSAPHLHFDAYLNGTPIDPSLLFSGSGASSYVRLCPVEAGKERAGNPAQRPPVPASLWSKVAHPFAVAAGWLGDGLDAVWRGGAAVVTNLGRGFAQWGHWIAVGAKWCWGNRYFQAIVAGLLSAAIVIAAIIVVVITLPVSVLCGVIAGIAACVAALGIAIYYAATHADNFSFSGCFLKSLSAGAAVGATVVSAGSLSAAFSAGWAELGVVGAGKCALANGVLAAIFEGSSSYLLTGRVSVARIVAAFVIGVIAGPVTKIAREGIVGSRLVQALLVSVEEGRLAVASQTAVLFLKQSGEVVHGMLIFLKQGATAFGGKAVYLLFSGTFAVSCNLGSCLIGHKPITMAGLVASFATGLIMGSIGLMFGGEGLEGLLSHFQLLDTGLGRLFRRYTFQVLTKGIHKAVSSGLESLFKRLFHERDVPLAKEE